MFKDGTGACAARSTCPGFPVRGNRAGVFSMIFVLYLNNIPS